MNKPPSPLRAVLVLLAGLIALAALGASRSVQGAWMGAAVLFYLLGAVDYARD
jgi:hypothetical protein